MEDFFQRFHGAVRQHAFGLDEEPGHFTLPTFIHFALRHPGAGTFEIVGFEISDEKAVRAQEQ